jgi:hypothetical protein
MAVMNCLAITTNQLMLNTETIAVYSQMHTNTRCGQNIALLNVKAAGAYDIHWTLIFNTHRTITCVFKFFTKFK